MTVQIALFPVSRSCSKTPLRQISYMYHAILVVHILIWETVATIRCQFLSLKALWTQTQVVSVIPP